MKFGAHALACALRGYKRLANFAGRPCGGLGVRRGHVKFELGICSNCSGASCELVDGVCSPRVELQALHKRVFDTKAAVHAAARRTYEHPVVDGSP